MFRHQEDSSSQVGKDKAGSLSALQATSSARTERLQPSLDISRTHEKKQSDPKAITRPLPNEFTFLKSVIEASEECVIVIDTQYNLVIVNEKARRMGRQQFGCTVEVGMNVADLLKNTPDPVKSSQNAWDAALQGTTSEVIHQLTNEHGDIRYVRSRYRPLYDAYQHTIGAMQLTEDITKQKVAEERRNTLREVQAFRQLANHMPQLVWSTNAAGQIDFTNSRFRRYTGQEVRELKAEGWQKLIHPDDLPQALKIWYYAFQTGKPCEFEYRMLRASDQTYRWHLIQSIPLKNEQGDIIHWIGTATDIHEHKEQTERVTHTNLHLKQINQYLDDFVHATAHNLRAPVTNLQLFMRTFVQLSPQEQEELIPKIARNINRLDNTLKGLVQLIDLQSQPTIETQMVPITNVIQEVLKQYRPLLQEVRAHVHLLDPDVSSIRYVRPYLRNIVNNLVSNAVKYRDWHRPLQLKIMVQKLVNYCVLIVEDNGRGIDLQKYGDKLFQPFRRFTNQEEGLGIGLHMIRTIAEKNGGKVEVISQPNMGTAFKIYLKEYA